MMLTTQGKIFIDIVKVVLPSIIENSFKHKPHLESSEIAIQTIEIAKATTEEMVKSLEEDSDYSH